MEKHIKSILIINESGDFSSELSDFIGQKDDSLTVTTCTSGDKAVELLNNNTYDYVITDLILPVLDGFEILEAASKLNPRPKVMVLSSITLDNFVEKAMEIGCDAFLSKTTTKDLVYKRMIESLEPKSKSQIKTSKNRALDEKISNIFITVGIPAHIKGYQFLREAIKMAIDNPEIINSITKQLYPSIASRFETSASKVERAIRHAIEVAWNRGKIENINNLFGIKVYSSNEKPTNGEFIALVADKMLIEGA